MMKYLINFTKLISGRIGIELYILLNNFNTYIKDYLNIRNMKKYSSKSEYIVNNTILNSKKAQR